MMEVYTIFKIMSSNLILINQHGLIECLSNNLNQISKDCIKYISIFLV